MLQVQKQCLSTLLRDLGLPSWEFSKSKSDWSAVSYTFTLTPCQMRTIIFVLRLATHERSYLSVESAEAGDKRKNCKGWRRRRRMGRWRETALPPIITKLSFHFFTADDVVDSWPERLVPSLLQRQGLCSLTAPMDDWRWMTPSLPG